MYTYRHAPIDMHL
jgi:hypothetical protein